MPGRLRHWFRTAVDVLAVSYPILLLGVILLLRFVGERWWVTGVVILLPRAGFALPLPLVVLGIVITRRWRLLWWQLASVLLLLFPLMGLNIVAFRPVAADGQRKVRVLSYNANSGYGDYAAIADEIAAFKPDIAVLQELFIDPRSLQEALRPSYPHIDVSTQFMLASKFPIRAVTEPARVESYGVKRSPRFIKYLVDAPFGPLTIFNVHPISPRHGIYAIRGAGLRRELQSGRFFRGEQADKLQGTASLREAQIRAVAQAAESVAGPVLIAGDTNLPGLSPLWAHLRDYRDAFSEVRSGFGYTYPTKQPWMRLDRILANERLQFVHFEMGSSRASDHFCVVADVVKDLD